MSQTEKAAAQYAEQPLLRKFLLLFDRSDHWKLAGLLCMMLLGAFFEVLGVGMILPLLTVVSAPETLKDYAAYDYLEMLVGTLEPSELLILLAALLFLVFIVKNAYLLYLKYVIAKFVYTRQVKLGTRLMETFMHAPYLFHVRENSSTIIQTINLEVRYAFSSTLLPAANALVELVVIGAVVCLLLIVDPYATLIAAAVFGGVALSFLKIIRKIAYQLGKSSQKSQREMIKWVQQGLGGIKEIKVLNREHFFVDRFKKESSDYSDVMQRYRLISEVPRPLIETIGVGMILLLLVLMISSGESVSGILPVLGLFGFAAFRLMPSVNRIVTSLTQVRGHGYAVDSVLAALDIADDTKSISKAGRSFEFEDEVRFREVTFRYAEDQPTVLKELNLTIDKGSVVGLVGTSGSGKSTIISLLMGLLTPSDGRITADGSPILEMLAQWQRSFGYIAQSTYLCDDTLRRNVALGVPDDKIDEASVQKAIKLARLDEFVRSLPDGLDTTIGEQGMRISGGQRQRIGIARALYHDPPILVMDEATSSLDNRTERDISDAIQSLRGSKTVLMIAHRLTTVAHCDRILFLQEGRVTADGTYEELLESSEAFRDLVTAWDRRENPSGSATLLP